MWSSQDEWSIFISDKIFSQAQLYSGDSYAITLQIMKVHLEHWRVTSHKKVLYRSLVHHLFIPSAPNHSIYFLSPLKCLICKNSCSDKFQKNRMFLKCTICRKNTADGSSMLESDFTWCHSHIRVDTAFDAKCWFNFANSPLSTHVIVNSNVHPMNKSTFWQILSFGNLVHSCQCFRSTKSRMICPSPILFSTKHNFGA